MKKNIICLIFTIIILSACQENSSEPTLVMSESTVLPTSTKHPTLTQYPTYTPIPTSTDYPTQTPYPTYTPIPTVQPIKQDISSAMALPEESLDWYLTYDNEFYFETWTDQNGIHSRMESMTEDGNTGIKNLISCSEQPFNQNSINFSAPYKELETDVPTFGDLSKAYEYKGRIGHYSVYFLYGNCFVELYSQRFTSPQPVYEMAEKISERLRTDNKIYRQE